MSIVQSYHREMNKLAGVKQPAPDKNRLPSASTDDFQSDEDADDNDDDDEDDESKIDEKLLNKSDFQGCYCLVSRSERPCFKVS